MLIDERISHRNVKSNMAHAPKISDMPLPTASLRIYDSGRVGWEMKASQHHLSIESFVRVKRVNATFSRRNFSYTLLIFCHGSE